MSNQRIFKKNLIARSIQALTIPIGMTSVGISYAQEAVLEEIVVSATRRAESVQDIPINISAVGAEQIDKQGFGDLSELISFVPGINTADQGGRDGNRIVVRGLNADPVANPNSGQENGGGSVATYIGEVPLFVDLRLNDLQRVEVLLGPQGTLYGAGTLGGAIRYIPNKPNFEKSEYEARADIFSYDGGGTGTDLGFTFNVPLSDTFAIRGSVDNLDDGGFIDNPFIVSEIGVSNPDPDFTNEAEREANFSPVNNANTEDILSGRIAARWQPTDAIDATLTYYFQNGEYGGRNASSLRSSVPTGEFEFANRVREPSERDSELLALEITADLGFAELTSATGIASVEENGQRDQTDLLISLEYSYETFPTFTAFTFDDEESDIFNQEIRLVSTGDGPLSWIVGGFYNKNEYNALSSEFTPGFGPFAGFDDDFGDLEFFQADRTELEESALFGEISYDITENWDVTFGVRFYTYDFQNASRTEFPFFLDEGDFTPFTLSEIESQLPFQANQSFNDELFKLNTSYTFNDGTLIYATFSQGFRVGAANLGEACPDVFVAGSQDLCLLSEGQQLNAAGDVAQFNEQEFVPDTVDNYELGFKTTLLDGSLSLTGAIYFIDWNDPQVGAVSVNASLPITVNAESAESKGFELAANWKATDRLLISGNISYSDAELTADVPSLVRTINTPGFGTAFEDGQSGDQLPGSPESQFSLFVEYDHPLANGNSLVFNGAYAWQDEVLSFAGGRGDSFTLPSFGRANASVAYITDNWSITGYVDNLFDDFSETSASNTPLFNQTVLGANVRSFRTNVLAPRTFGVRMKYNF